MSADLAARLRALAQDHQAGRLSLTAYRKLRTPLLDSLALPHPPGIDEMAVTQPRSLVRAAGSAAQPRSVPQRQSAASSKFSSRAIGAVLGLLLVAAVAVGFLRRPAPDDATVVDTTVGASPVHELVRPFLERGDWSDSRVAALNVALLEIGERPLAAVATEPWFQRFVDDLRQRFKERQALAPAPLTPHTSPLAALAATVGLDLNSPDAAIRIATIDAPATTAAAESVSAESAAASQPAAEPASPAASQRNAQADAPAGEREVDARVADAGLAAAERTPRPSAITNTSTSTSAKAPAEMSQSACRVELIRSRRPFCQDRLSSGELGPRLALIPAGAFDMGGVGVAAEQPVHRVTIAEPFAMSVHEVSQAEYRLYCAHAQSPCAAQPWSGNDYPAVNVSWRDARGYAEWLSAMTGQRYRLPSESQWEYAARAGQSGAAPGGGDAPSLTDAHYSMLTEQTAPARRSQKFNQNAFRLLHTLGNVREWVEDAWVEGFAGAPADGSAVRSPSSDVRVARGGSYVDNAAKLRLSTREPLPADTRDAFTGFRVVRELP